jgi:hypothetical protein
VTYFCEVISNCRWSHLLSFSLFLLSAGWVCAQPNREVWIIPDAIYLGEGFKKWRLDVAFDGRNSFSEGESVRVAGLRIGVEYMRVNRFGFGIYDLSAPVRKATYTNADTSFAPASLTLRYNSIYYERVLYFDREWEVSATGHLGAGQIIVNKPDELTGVFRYYETLDVTPLELSASGYYHLTWWLSAGLGLGYRMMLNTPREIMPLYNSTVYLVKVKVRTGKALRMLWDKNARNEY